MTTEHFGNLPDGRPVERVRLRAGNMQANVLTLGAIVQDLRMAGVGHPLVLGADKLTPYLRPMNYFGAMVGRFANRIAQGRYSADGQTYHLSRNFHDRHCLHGGRTGSSRQLWTIAQCAADSVHMTLRMPDGENGFPGNLDVALTVSLTEGALQFDISATTDRATPCSFSHHGYFNLDDSGSLAQHTLRIAAGHYLPVDHDLIPTGEVAPVAETRLDFNHARSLHGLRLDHNFCLSSARTECRPVAWLASRESGLHMQVDTTEPGLQVYTAGHLPEAGVEGLEGRSYATFAGVALEAQAWPDSLNRTNFPNATLQPGDTYQHRTRYSFSDAQD